jgi:hypothetical protein
VPCVESEIRLVLTMTGRHGKSMRLALLLRWGFQRHRRAEDRRRENQARRGNGGHQPFRRERLVVRLHTTRVTSGNS